MANISRNPNDIDKYVTKDGKPVTGKPLWTWIPGGNLVYLANELGHGRTTETGDWFWAGVDIVTIAVPAGRVSMSFRLAAEETGSLATKEAGSGCRGN